MTLVIAVTLLAGACQTGVWMGPENGPKVSVIGDSLVFHAEGNNSTDDTNRMLADELVADGYRAHVSGYIGETIPLAHDRLWSKVSAEPLDTLVIALGTNDSQKSTLDETREALRTWLAETTEIRCVALIGVNEQAWSWDLDVLGPPINQMLREEAAAAGNAIFVPWEPDLSVHGTTGDVHFEDAAGRAQYRATLRGAVARCADFDSPVTTTTTVPTESTTTTAPIESTTTTTPESSTTTAPIESTTTTPESPTTTVADRAS